MLTVRLVGYIFRSLLKQAKLERRGWSVHGSFSGVSHFALQLQRHVLQSVRMLQCNADAYVACEWPADASTRVSALDRPLPVTPSARFLVSKQWVGGG